jgi:DNA replication and repair protein RecF
VRVGRLWLTDFRNYTEATVEPAPDGLTVIVGGNGQGKTNILEAVGYLATMQSFRGAPTAALVRSECTRAVVRAEGERADRRLLVEVELHAVGRDRAFLNRQPLRRARDLLGALRVTVFSPDDLVLVKGGPTERRRLLDDLLVARHARNDRLLADFDKVLRQRNRLLKQAAGQMRADVTATLDVWDSQLVALGGELAFARAELVAELEPEVGKAYGHVAAASGEVALAYVTSWEGDLAAAVAASRRDDVRRGLTLVGPHRDDLAIELAGLPARTHASQGEQRSLALALRLAGHRVIAGVVDEPPVLLLDDVFSELDSDRSEALLAHLPTGQAILTTAGGLPPAAAAARIYRVHDGRIEEGGAR